MPFRAVDFLRPVDLRAVDFLRPVAFLRPVDLRAVDFFRPVDLRAVDFLRVAGFLRAVDFLRPVVLRPVLLRAAVRRPVALRAVDFLAVDLRAPLVRFRPVVFFAANCSTSSSRLEVTHLRHPSPLEATLNYARNFKNYHEHASQTRIQRAIRQHLGARCKSTSAFL